MATFPPILQEPYAFVEFGELRFRKFIPRSIIKDRIDYVGKQIAEDYKDKNPVVIGVLKGAVYFLMDLLNAASIECQLDFTQLSSYKGTESTGKISEHLSIATDLKDRHVIVVEDIVDTGGTLHYFLNLIQQKEPASLELAALLLKPNALKHDIDIKYLGFNIADQFVIGYGMDYNESGRNLPDIYQLDMPSIGS